MAEPGAPMRVTVGCIGSRDLAPESAAACRKIGADLARAAVHVITGATPGEPGRDAWAAWAGGAVAYGVSRVASTSLTVCLPWRRFPHGSGQPEPGVRVLVAEEQPTWTAEAEAFWRATHDEHEGEWSEAVPRALRLRHTRNIGIVLAATMLLIWPEGEDLTTPFATEFAHRRDVPVLDLTQTAWWAAVEALAERAREAGSHVLHQSSC